MMELSTTPRIATQVCTAAGSEVRLRMASAQRKPMNTPIRPPTMHCMTLSVRNCIRISCCVAPIARRTPISLVRSVTLTNMTFMITIPPTTEEIELTITNTAKNAELIPCHRDITLGRADIEVLVTAFGDVAAGAHDYPHVVLRLLKQLLAAGSLDLQRQTVARAADSQVSIERDDHESILILAQDGTDGLERPDYREVFVARLDHMADRVHPGKQLLDQRSEERRVGRGVAVFRLRKIAA